MVFQVAIAVSMYISFGFIFCDPTDIYDDLGFECPERLAPLASASLLRRGQRIMAWPWTLFLVWQDVWQKIEKNTEDSYWLNNQSVVKQPEKK
jgi:hypothetical protein